jgi:hypothetical protein
MDWQPGVTAVGTEARESSDNVVQQRAARDRAGRAVTALRQDGAA